jgi:hypothetical protein
MELSFYLILLPKFFPQKGFKAMFQVIEMMVCEGAVEEKIVKRNLPKRTRAQKIADELNERQSFETATLKSYIVRATV